MKKIYSFALALLALPFILSSCSNDNELPNVAFNMAVSGGVMDNNTIYIVRGDTLNIESLNVTNLDSDKAAAVTDAQYYWDYNFIGANPFAPYNFSIDVGDSTAVGDHMLTVRAGVIAVDKTPAFAIVDYPVVVVADSTQMPANPLTTSTIQTSLKQ